MKKALKLSNSKGAKKKRITTNNSFSSFDNSFACEEIVSDFFVKNVDRQNYQKDFFPDSQINIEESSPPQSSVIRNSKDTIMLDHSSDLNSVLRPIYSDSNRARPSFQEKIKMGSGRRFETLQRSTKRDTASDSFYELVDENAEPKKFPRRNVPENPIIIEDSSSSETSVNQNYTEMTELDIDTDNSSEGVLEPENEAVARKSFDFNSVLIPINCDAKDNRIRVGNQKAIKDGYGERLEILLRRNISDNAITKYINRFAKESEFSKSRVNSVIDHLVVLHSYLSFNFIQAWTERVDNRDRIITIISPSQVPVVIDVGMILVVVGKRSVTEYNDTVVWYDIEQISIIPEDDANGICHAIVPIESQTVSVACDCLTRNPSGKIIPCPNSQRNVQAPKYQGYGFEKKFDKKCILVLKKLRFWYNTITRYCVVFIRYCADNIGTMYVTVDSFDTIVEGYAYLLKDEVRLPDTCQIYGSSKHETKNYVYHIYQQLSLMSQDKIIRFMGKIPSEDPTINFNFSFISNFDGRLSTIHKIESQFIEYLPNWLDPEKSPDNCRFNLTGIVFSYGIERFEDHDLLKMFLFTTGLQNKVHEIVVKSLCIYPLLAWSRICKIYLIDCYKSKGRFIADQFTVVSMNYINTMTFSNIILKEATTIETISDVMNATSGTVARFQGLSLVKEEAEHTMYCVCSNCLSIIEDSVTCTNCSGTRHAHLYLYSLKALIQDMGMERTLTFMSRKVSYDVETLMILGDVHKLCLVLDL